MTRSVSQTLIHYHMTCVKPLGTSVIIPPPFSNQVWRLRPCQHVYGYFGKRSLFYLCFGFMYTQKEDFQKVVQILKLLSLVSCKHAKSKFIKLLICCVFLGVSESTGDQLVVEFLIQQHVCNFTMSCRYKLIQRCQNITLLLDTPLHITPHQASAIHYTVNGDFWLNPSTIFCHSFTSSPHTWETHTHALHSYLLTILFLFFINLFILEFVSCLFPPPTLIND